MHAPAQVAKLQLGLKPLTTNGRWPWWPLLAWS